MKRLSVIAKELKSTLHVGANMVEGVRFPDGAEIEIDGSNIYGSLPGQLSYLDVRWMAFPEKYSGYVVKAQKGARYQKEFDVGSKQEALEKMAELMAEPSDMRY